MWSPARLVTGVLLIGLGSAVASPTEWPCPSFTGRKPLVLMQLPKWNKYVSSLSDEPGERIRTSKVLETLGAELEEVRVPTNIMLIGACDGTHDEIIEYSLKHDNTAMLMVEPVSHNADDVEKIIANVGYKRMELVRGAVDAGCEEEGSTRIFTQISKKYENDTSKDQRHFARRQLGSLRPSVASFLKGRFREYAETVAVDCVSPRRLLQRFGSFQTRMTAHITQRENCVNAKGWPVISANVRRHLRDLHLLKVDTEGADYDIMKDFMQGVWCKECAPIEDRDADTQTSLSRSRLFPLIIQYETHIFENIPGNKSDGKAKIEELEGWLRTHGYRLKSSAEGDRLALRQFTRN